MKFLLRFVLAPQMMAAEVGLAQPPAQDGDTRGPVVNAGMTVKVDLDGVQAPGYVWRKPETKTSWTAQWIASGAWRSRLDCELFTQGSRPNQKPKKVTAWIASNNYLLFINGRSASRGPADPGSDFQGGGSKRRLYDCRDLTRMALS